MKSVLIAEDNEDARKVLSIVLRKTNFTVLQVASGSNAVKAAQEYSPSVLLLDLVLAGPMDGFEVCQTLKSDVRTASIYIVVMSGKNQHADFVRARRAGANAYLVKPFRLSKLLDIVIHHERLSADFILETTL